MNRLLALTEKIATGATWVSGVILLATACLIAVEVTLRKGFSISLGGADEISSYALAICCSWTLAFALLKKAHVRVDVLYFRMSRKLQYALDLFSLALFGFVMVVLTYYAFLVVKTSLVKKSIANTPLATPLWIPQGVWFAGLALFTATILVVLAATVLALIRRDWKRARELSGASSLMGEDDEED